MAVAIATKVDALRVDFGSSARLADMLGVSRAQVTRWLRGSGIDPLNAEKVDLLELVWSNLLRLYDRDAALAWLFGLNPVLGDRRPIDLIREGRTEELMRAIRAERSGPPPAAGDHVDVPGGARLVARVGGSPAPGPRIPCAYLLA